MSDINLSRSLPPKDHQPQRTPIVSSDGSVMLDPHWGTIQPMILAPNVVTIGELEMIAHIQKGGAVIDTRQTRYYEDNGHIPTALSAPWQTVVEDVQDYIKNKVLTKDSVLALYCNGPQCPATPKAIHLLIESGWPAERLLYYRGGIMDWVSLGLPIEK